jgi:hypothetical protein
MEAVIPSLSKAIARSPANRGDLHETIRDRLGDAYHKAANRTVRDLYADAGGEPPAFLLQAKWKQRALDQQARAMADSLSQTVSTEQARLEGLGLSAADVREKTATYLQRKTRQLQEIIDAEATMQAQVDQVVHTGIVDPAKDRVMYLHGPHTCPWCDMIFAGNPFTVNEATNYGAKIHPNCKDHWEQQWALDDATLQVAKQRIRDGSVKVWTGTGTTPGPQSAKAGAAITQRHSTDWRQQKRKAIRDARRRGVDEETVNAALTRRQLRERERTVQRTEKRRQSRQTQREYLEQAAGGGGA